MSSGTNRHPPHSRFFGPAGPFRLPRGYRSAAGAALPRLGLADPERALTWG
ncbi:hypothetical protein [Streptomyces sp. L2]|uniref:hypothetical protein n=1 Tax=Streptomyces sp. L2 TaxID=2162665 RepID=UPI0013E97BA0|nr:hypothetical protein [Streptomyces sp. L2]